MKKIITKITLNRSLKDAFAFCIDPQNTPKWVTSIDKEETNEWPVKVGTIYSQITTSGERSAMVLTAYNENKAFTMTEGKKGNHVTYQFRPLKAESTELTYIWVDNGELSEAFIQSLVDNLKKVIELK